MNTLHAPTQLAGIRSDTLGGRRSVVRFHSLARHYPSCDPRAKQNLFYLSPSHDLCYINHDKLYLSGGARAR